MLNRLKSSHKKSQTRIAHQLQDESAVNHEKHFDLSLEPSFASENIHDS